MFGLFILLPLLLFRKIPHLALHYFTFFIDNLKPSTLHYKLLYKNNVIITIIIMTY